MCDGNVVKIRKRNVKVQQTASGQQSRKAKRHRVKIIHHSDKRDWDFSGFTGIDLSNSSFSRIEK